MITSSFISNIFDNSVAYIYIWVSKNSQCVYVGQTNSAAGVIGRANAHVQKNGTLRARFYDDQGQSIEVTNDWFLLSFSLPKKKKYTNVESSFRLAVEYLVQIKLHEIRSDLVPRFKLISNVTYTDYCGELEVKRISDDIVESFIDNYVNNLISV